MKVLFVYSANKGMSPIIKNQAVSLEESGIEISYYGILGKGLWGYITNIFPLKSLINNTRPDIIHAHYSFCGMISSLATSKPIVVSLMGSDVKANHLWKKIIRLFIKFSWKETIVKSRDLEASIKMKKVKVIPNGVDLMRFKYIPIDKAINVSKWDKMKKNILFAANPNNPVKNFKLATKAFNLLNDTGFELHCLENIENEKMAYYFNSANVVLLTSQWEGSPNVIKEAMACNRPIVTTEVGDVQEILKDTSGTFVVKPDPVLIREPF